MIMSMKSWYLEKKENKITEISVNTLPGTMFKKQVHEKKIPIHSLRP